MEHRKVTIVGSYNVGLFLKGQAIPSIGETVIGDSFFEGGGGKGSNQAVAASLLGAETTFIGRIGDDKYGRDALAMYKKLGINTERVKVDANSHTGISVILIDRAGNNSICVIPGANFKLSREDINDALSTMANSWIVGFQLENSLDVVGYAIRKVRGMGVRTLLDPAPAVKLPENLYPHIWCIKPNEHEASILTGIEVTDAPSAKKAGKWFIEKGVDIAVITLGGQGAVLVTADKTKHFPSLKVDTVDTTGAGDCFSGALMAALCQGGTMDEAIDFAICAAAISVTRPGVIEALPLLSEVQSRMDVKNMQKEQEEYLNENYDHA